MSKRTKDAAVVVPPVGTKAVEGTNDEDLSSCLKPSKSEMFSKALKPSMKWDNDSFKGIITLLMSQLPNVKKQVMILFMCCRLSRDCVLDASSSGINNRNNLRRSSFGRWFWICFVCPNHCVCPLLLLLDLCKR